MTRNRSDRVRVALESRFGLIDQVALVTGAARGIGLGVATSLAAAGADVVLGDVNIALARKSAAEIAKDYDVRAIAVALDVSREESVTQAIAATESQLGRLDILVNNAGIFPNEPIRSMPAEMWDRVIGVNLRGAFLSTRYGAELMIKCGNGGRIVNISSINTRKTYIGMAHYDASKAGIEALTRAAALEYAPFQICVNAIAPGAVITPGASANLEIVARIVGGTAEGALEAFTKTIPHKRWALPEDIGNAVLCLTGRAAQYVTGQTIYVDGGLSVI